MTDDTAALIAQARQWPSNMGEGWLFHALADALEAMQTDLVEWEQVEAPRWVEKHESEKRAIRAELDAARATIAEALSITVDGRGIVSALGRIRDVLSRGGDNA